jgi:hypothetical protein
VVSGGGGGGGIWQAVSISWAIVASTAGRRRDPPRRMAWTRWTTVGERSRRSGRRWGWCGRARGGGRRPVRRRRGPPGWRTRGPGGWTSFAPFRRWSASPEGMPPPSGRGGVARVADHVEHRPVGVLDEEAPHPPRLVGQRMDQRKAAPQRLGIDSVDVGDLDGDLRDDRRRRVLNARR